MAHHDMGDFSYSLHAIGHCVMVGWFLKSQIYFIGYTVVKQLPSSFSPGKIKLSSREVVRTSILCHKSLLLFRMFPAILSEVKVPLLLSQPCIIYYCGLVIVNHLIPKPRLYSSV